MKFAIVGGLGALALIFLIAAAATPWGVVKVEANGVKDTTTYDWQKMKRCVKGNGIDQCVEQKFTELNDAADKKCGKAVNNTRAALAFVILTILITVAGAGCAFAGAVVKTQDLAKFGGFALGGAALFCLIGWAITISLYTQKLCDFDQAKSLKDEDNSKMGPSAPLQIVAWLFLIGGAVAGVVLPSAGGASKVAPADAKEANDK